MYLSHLSLHSCSLLTIISNSAPLITQEAWNGDTVNTSIFLTLASSYWILELTVDDKGVISYDP